MVRRLVKFVNPIHMKGKLKYLLFSLIFLLFLYPHLEDGNLEAAVLNLLFSVVLLTGLYSVSYDKNHFLIGLALGIPALITNWLNYPSEHILLAHVFAIMFYSYTIITLITYLVKAVTVTQDLLFGAISVYLLMGITFGAVFSMVESIYPGSFEVNSDNIEDEYVHWSDLTYFSFTTLTTLGYGDITAQGSAARSMAIFEAVAGQMYITMIVAKLVGLSISQNRN